MRCWNEFLTTDMKEKEFPAVSPEEVFQLLRRLEMDILPNIIPDNTLLGIPASFSAILNASAIYRIHVLSTSESNLEPRYNLPRHSEGGTTDCESTGSILYPARVQEVAGQAMSVHRQKMPSRI